jgi:hypothetical protein
VTDRVWTIEDLINDLINDGGISREEAEKRFVDDDLWLLPPDVRVSFASDVEAALEWKRASDFFWWLSHVGINTDTLTPAITQLINDAHERAEEALRRARKWAEQATTE